MTDASTATVAMLRDGSNFQWYVIPLMVIVIYIYSNEISKKQWSVVLAGLALWGMDWFNEIWNSLILHFTGTAPFWGIAKNTAYVILVGLNIEICFMFAIAGICFVKTLPEDKNMKILGLNNRWFLAVAFSIFSVIVEIFLNLAGALIWEYPCWNIKFPFLIFLLGYLPFFVMSFVVFDMESRKKQIMTVGSIFAFDAVCLVLFMGILGWI